jgi:uncharacterized protein YjbI with pentapeptide repeats
MPLASLPTNETMNIRNTFFILSALLAISLFAAGMSLLTGGQTDSLSAAQGQANKFLAKSPSTVTSPSAEPAVFPEDAAEAPVTLEPESPVSGVTRPASGRLTGVFRGDWGETPVYAKNDRVNHEDAAYLSLENGNQNQPPAVSPNYWRLLKTFQAADAQACAAPKSGADLSKCDFSDEVSLKDRDLSGAVLKKARLSGELGSANLNGADLSGAAVIGSLVIGPNTRLENANLSKLQSDGNNPLIADSADLNHANLSEAKLYGAKLNHVNLAGARLTGGTLTGAELSASRLEGAELGKSNLSFANLTGGFLVHASLGEADLSESNLTDADLSQTNLRQANLAGADLKGSDFSGADLNGADLRSAKNTELALIDAQTDFTSAICPDGVTVDGTQVTTCVGHGF